MRLTTPAGKGAAWAFGLALLVRFAALPFAQRAPLGEGHILLDAAGNIAAGKGLSLSDTLLATPPDAPPIYRATLAHWRGVGGVWGVVRPGTPTAFLPPFYPLLLAALEPLGGTAIRLCGALVGAAAVALSFLLAGKLWGVRAGAVAGILAAVDPLAVYQSLEISSHALAALTVLLPVWLLLKARLRFRSGLAAGLLCAVAFLVRPTAWLMVLLLLGWALSHSRKAALGIALGLAVGLAPWVTRNAFSLGTPAVFTTNGGRNLWEFNNGKLAPEYLWSEPAVSRSLYDPIRARHLPHIARVDLLPFPHFTDEPETVRDRVLTRNFLGFIRANPGAYGDLVALRVTQMLSPWPLHAGGAARAFFAVFNIPVLVLACTGVWLALRRGGLAAVLALFVIGFLTVHAMTAAGFVYRGMIAPMLAIMAGGAVQAIVPQRLLPRRTGPVHPMAGGY